MNLEPEITDELDPKRARLGLSDSADHRTLNPERSTGSGEGHLRSSSNGEDHATPAAADSTDGPLPDRRGLIAAAVGAGAAALLAKPKDAAADLSFGDVEGAVGSALRSVVRPLLQAINSTLGDILRFFREIFALIGLRLPAEIWRFINVLLELLDAAGEDGFIRAGQARSAIERSYPPEGITTPNFSWDMALRQGERTRARVEQSMEINATVAEANGDIATAEDAIHAAALASGSVAAYLEAILVMTQSTNLRLGHISTQLAAIAQMLADQTMQASSAKEQAAWQGLEFLNEEGREIAEPVDRPAR